MVQTFRIKGKINSAYPHIQGYRRFFNLLATCQADFAFGHSYDEIYYVNFCRGAVLQPAFNRLRFSIELFPHKWYNQYVK